MPTRMYFPSDLKRRGDEVYATIHPATLIANDCRLVALELRSGDYFFADSAQEVRRVARALWGEESVVDLRCVGDESATMKLEEDLSEVSRDVYSALTRLYEVSHVHSWLSEDELKSMLPNASAKRQEECIRRMLSLALITPEAHRDDIRYVGGPMLRRYARKGIAYYLDADRQ